MILISLLMCWLLQRMEAALLLSPRGTIFEYVHGTVSLTCYEANHQITTFQWNLTPSLSSSAYHINSDQYSATLEILDALRIFNGTVIQCQGNYSNGDVENSNKAELILQDTPLAVENFKISVGDYSIFLTWSAPFLLFDNDKVRYLVSIENLTGLITTNDNTSTTNYVLTSSLHRIACDEFKITITPENWAGIGMNRSINLIYGEILVTNRSLTLNSKSHFDLLLLVTSPICEIMDMHIINVNLNETFRFDKEFTNFSLIQDFDEGYQYYLKLDLQRRYQYEISMSLENGNTSKYLSFNISTHLVRDVHIEPISSDVLEIEIFYNSYSNTSNQTGAFLSMLYCNSELCDDNEFNPKNSLYLSIFETGANIYNITYTSGNYLVYLFDTDSDGSLLSSYNSTCVSLFIKRLNLTLYGAQYFVASKKPCEIVYENDTVGSLCSLNEIRDNMEAKKQIVLQQLTYRNSLLLDIYGPTPISERDCMRVEKQITYGIIIAVSNYQKERNIEPIGRRSLSDASLQALCYPDAITEPAPTSSGGKHFRIILGIVISIIFLLLLLLFPFVIVWYLCFYKAKHRVQKIKTT